MTAISEGQEKAPEQLPRALPRRVASLTAPRAPGNLSSSASQCVSLYPVQPPNPCSLGATAPLETETGKEVGPEPR